MTKNKSHYNAHLFPVKGKVFTKGKSLTIPDQALTVEEILKRHVRGLPFYGSRVGEFAEDGDEQVYPDLNKMDLAEREEYLMDLAERLEKNREEVYQKKRDHQEQLKKQKNEQENRNVKPTRGEAGTENSGNANGNPVQ